MTLSTFFEHVAEPVQVKPDDFERVPHDVNGNPRFVVHFLQLGLHTYASTPQTRKAGLSLYRAKWYGGGFVVTSYNLASTCKFINDTLNA